MLDISILFISKNMKLLSSFFALNLNDFFNNLNFTILIILALTFIFLIRWGMDPTSSAMFNDLKTNGSNGVVLIYWIPAQNKWQGLVLVPDDDNWWIFGRPASNSLGNSQVIPCNPILGNEVIAAGGKYTLSHHANPNSIRRI